MLEAYVVDDLENKNQANLSPEKAPKRQINLL